MGTHEQGLDRLFIELDNLINKEEIKEEVFAQIGYSSYLPKNYEYKRMINYDCMDSYIKNANIIITHAGPGSIFHSLQYNKIPIVVPRNPIFDEHVDNHQILFAKKLQESKKILAIYDIKDLNKNIKEYSILTKNCVVNERLNKEFIDKFSNLIKTRL